MARTARGELTLAAVGDVGAATGSGTAGLATGIGDTAGGGVATAAKW